MSAVWTSNDDCPRCYGESWLWWYMLAEYDGPANETGQDDTQYMCDHKCHMQEVPEGCAIIMDEKKHES